MDNVNDQRYISLVKEGDKNAFAALVDRYKDMVFTLSLKMLKDRQEAEEVSQDSFLKVYKSLDRYKGESKFSTWLYRITVSKAMDHIRKKKRKKRFAFIQSLYGKNDKPVIDPPDFFHPGISMENKENAAVLFKAMEQLPPNQKTAFVLNKVEGLSYMEISDVMKITDSAVDALLHRAKANLKKILKDYYVAINKN